jgi:hypothetical protein
LFAIVRPTQLLLARHNLRAQKRGVPSKDETFEITLPDGRMLTCKLDSTLPDESGDLAATFKIVASMPKGKGEIEAGTYPVRFADFLETKARVKADSIIYGKYALDIREADGKLQYEGDLVTRIVLNHRPPAVTLYFGTPPGLKYRVFSGTVVEELSKIADNVGKSVPTVRIIDGQKFVFDETTQVERTP